MSLAVLATLGVLVALAVSYLSNLRSSHEGSAAMRLALTIPMGATAAVALVKPSSIFALSAIGRESGAPLTAYSKYPHGELAVSDQLISFGAQDASYWAYAISALSLALLIVAWRDYRATRRAESTAKSGVTWLLAAWVGLWVARFAALPAIPGEITEGEAGLKTFLQLSAAQVQVEQYLLPKEAWVYAPTQWYLALIGVGASTLSLLSLLFKPRSARRAVGARVASPLWTALAAALLVLVATFGAGDAHLSMRSSLWLAALLLSATSLSRLPQLQHQVALTTTLVILAGAY